MADATYTPTLLAKTKTSAELTATFSIAVGADDYVAGGILPLNTFSQKAGFTNRKPSWVSIEGNAGYIYEYVYATGKLIIRESAAAGNPLAEIPVAAMPAGVTGDTIRARVSYFTTPALMAI